MKDYLVRMRCCANLIVILTCATALNGQALPAAQRATTPDTVNQATRESSSTASIRLPLFVRNLPNSPLGPDPGPAPAFVAPTDAPLSFDAMIKRNGLHSNDFKQCRVEGQDGSDPLSALKACDRLLAFPAYLDFLWVQRETLLRDRAMVLLRLGQRRRALETLDEADAFAAQHGNPFWPVSGGIGNDLIRESLALADGSDSAASQRIRGIAARRPFSPSFFRTTRDFMAIGGPNAESLIADLELWARVDPENYRELVQLYLLVGKPHLAVRAASQVPMSRPTTRKGWKQEGGPTEFDLARATINTYAIGAYAAVVAGEMVAKERFLSKARAEVTGFIQPDPNRPLAAKVSADRRSQSVFLEGVIADWERAISRREAMTEPSIKSLDADLASMRDKQDVFLAYVEMMREVDHRADLGESLARRIANQYINRSFFYAWQGGIDEFRRKLPTVETDLSLGKIDRNLGMWFDDSLTGYSQSRESGSQLDIRTIHYETGEDSAPLAEELLALVIARYARKDGYDAFVILSRHTVARMVSSNGSNLGAGYDAQARVLMVRGRQLPSGSSVLPERIIAVDEIERNLGPRFKLYADYKAKLEAEEKAAKELQRLAKRAKKN